MSAHLSLTEAVEQLRIHPERPVRAVVEGGLVLELRAVPREAAANAADAFEALGRWDGETPEELDVLLAEARHGGRQRDVPAL